MFQVFVNKYFAELQGLIDQKKTSARLRFMILDVIDLRKVGTVQLQKPFALFLAEEAIDDIATFCGMHWLVVWTLT